MKKMFILIAAIASGFSASAHLIHTLHIKEPGKHGFKDVGEYSGLLIQKRWCLNPGTIICPYLCAGGTAFVHPDPSAMIGSSQLQPYQLDFIKVAMIDADASTQGSGLITKVYMVNNVQTVMTLKYTKSETSFECDVVENATYEQNVTELANL